MIFFSGADLRNGIPWFLHPSDQTKKVYVYLDPAHCIKLVRNWFSELKTFISENGNVISYDYIKKMYSIQEDLCLKLGNKLTNLHMNYKNRKMRVKEAVQLLSRSVADSLQLCLDLGKDNFFLYLFQYIVNLVKF
jgi:hypothetical protein